MSFIQRSRARWSMGNGAWRIRSRGCPRLLDIAHGPAESPDQEIAEPLFRVREIFRRIHRAQNIVVGNLAIESRNEPLKALFPDDAVDPVFHSKAPFYSIAIVTTFDSAPPILSETPTASPLGAAAGTWTFTW